MVSWYILLDDRGKTINSFQILIKIPSLLERGLPFKINNEDHTLNFYCKNGKDQFLGHSGTGNTIWGKKTGWNCCVSAFIKIKTSST